VRRDARVGRQRVRTVPRAQQTLAHGAACGLIRRQQAAERAHQRHAEFGVAQQAFVDGSEQRVLHRRLRAPSPVRRGDEAERRDRRGALGGRSPLRQRERAQRVHRDLAAVGRDPERERCRDGAARAEPLRPAAGLQLRQDQVAEQWHRLAARDLRQRDQRGGRDVVVAPGDRAEQRGHDLADDDGAVRARSRVAWRQQHVAVQLPPVAGLAEIRVELRIGPTLRPHQVAGSAPAMVLRVRWQREQGDGGDDGGAGHGRRQGRGSHPGNARAAANRAQPRRARTAAGIADGYRHGTTAPRLP
jgi:hypothetical protein